MNLNHHVVPLEMSIFLQQLGYPQFESNFYWAEPLPKEEDSKPHLAFYEFIKADPEKWEVIAAAPTGLELIEQIPIDYLLEHRKTGWHIMRKSALAAGYYDVKEIDPSRYFTTAAARVMLYLAQEKRFDLTKLATKKEA